jgi:hypothetical protein
MMKMEKRMKKNSGAEQQNVSSDEIISKSADEKLLWLLRIIISIEEGYYTCTQHV